ncbi:unnamed protein product [Schistocephalus solidus]|uniref:Uncharacterized protein n=1 Tax=Schistocephalus solidus TaxID=70667 RepID=A0A0X3Q8J5_SCHSO|nr:unnamed protein product [Schistocephalus solidus]
MTAVAPSHNPLPSVEPKTPSSPQQRPTLLSLAMKRRQAAEDIDPVELIRERILLQRKMSSEAEHHTPTTPNVPKTPQTPQVPNETAHPASPAVSADSKVKEPAKEPANEPAEDELAKDSDNEENLIDM